MVALVVAIAIGVSLSRSPAGDKKTLVNSDSTTTSDVMTPTSAVGLAPSISTPVVTPSLLPSISSVPTTSETLQLSTKTPNFFQFKCFGVDNRGCDSVRTTVIPYKCDQYGILGNAVRSYVSQDCANNKECDIAQVYGWPMNSWCVGNVQDMSYLFQDMETFDDDINGWNTSSVTNMKWMFYGASSFHGDLSNFDTSSVTDMESMFEDASSFNGDVSNFNTSSVTNMYSMFSYASSFSQDVTNFDLSSVTDMRWMFQGASSAWMGYMLYNASLFNQDLCAWRDSFPYTAKTDNIFTDSGCTYQDTPTQTQKGPFCASDCGISQEVSLQSLFICKLCLF